MPSALASHVGLKAAFNTSKYVAFIWALIIDIATITTRHNAPAEV